MSDILKDAMDSLIVEYLQSKMNGDGTLAHPVVTLAEVTYEEHQLCVAYKYPSEYEGLADNGCTVRLSWAQLMGFMYLSKAQLTKLNPTTTP